jgi:2-C-methyl-D-erythritol 4-phosphate cytidylyltransferase / 2-C-methyl-D-erythritol 2,4-cyclodiphosphate synthase
VTAPIADAVIVAAGASRRMRGMDKLEANVLGRPLLSYAVEAMDLASTVRRIVLVAAPGQVSRLRSAHWLRQHQAQVVPGGESRSASVLAGVRAADASIVLVHDGARPLASPALADRVARAALETGAAVPVVPLVDAVKRLAGELVAGSVEREGLVRAQTPQGARRELLLEAFAAARGASFSDEAGLLESQGVSVVSVPGEPLNLKVTEPDDLELVRAIVAARSVPGEPRVAVGQDSHPFGPADGLRLGGISLEDSPRLYGHSDGDVALHALASALLAGAGLGDLGRLFPATDEATRGAASSELLAVALRHVAAAGWRPTAAQVSIVGARPRLGASRLEDMRDRLAELLGLVPDAVAVVASSGNLNGAEGAGLAISASAIVTLVRA